MSCAKKDTGKTANLIMAACMMGSSTAGANETQINAAKEYALHIGLAFQIRDDILDVTGDAKGAWQEHRRGCKNARCTYVSLLGVEKAQALVDEHTEKALHALDAFDADSTFLHEFAEKARDAQQVMKRTLEFVIDCGQENMDVRTFVRRYFRAFRTRFNGAEIRGRDA